mmetsp:Transcript_6513/g.22398  ORF Transcript_6513/g.22398 Transcript_6513/m.22398 type:complete len:217 (+) Transcript_6513:6165-6815(+)
MEGRRWDSTSSAPPIASVYLRTFALSVMMTHWPSCSNCGLPALPAICRHRDRSYSTYLECLELQCLVDLRTTRYAGRFTPYAKVLVEHSATRRLDRKSSSTTLRSEGPSPAWWKATPFLTIWRSVVFSSLSASLSRSAAWSSSCKKWLPALSKIAEAHLAESCLDAQKMIACLPLPYWARTPKMCEFRALSNKKSFLQGWYPRTVVRSFTGRISSP